MACVNDAGVPEPTPVRESLLAAAHARASAGPWAAVRMADVARDAGVSRQTLYATFGSRDGLAAALAERTAQAFLQGAVAEVRAAGTPRAALERAVGWALRVAADDVLVKSALTDDRGSLLAYLTTRSEPVVVPIARAVAAALCERWPRLRPADAAWAAEAAVRLTVSYLLAPTGPPEQYACRVADLTAPLLAARPGQGDDD
jgi:AcrR family transcriptional regulator